MTKVLPWEPKHVKQKSEIDQQKHMQVSHKTIFFEEERISGNHGRQKDKKN